MKDYRKEFDDNIRNLGQTILACDYKSEDGFFNLRQNILNWIGEVKDKDILDAGCGWGLFSQPLVKDNRVFGLDFSFGMVQAASKKMILPMNGDTCYLPIKSQSMDIIFSIHVVQTIDGFVDLIDELIRVLRPGGTIIICTLSKSSLIRTINRFIHSFINPKEINPNRYYYQDLVDRFQKHGLDNIEVMSLYYPSGRYSITKTHMRLIDRLVATSFAIKAN